MNVINVNRIQAAQAYIYCVTALFLSFWTLGDDSKLGRILRSHGSLTPPYSSSMTRVPLSISLQTL